MLSAVNSSKWYPYDEANADNFSDFGDDEVSACGECCLVFFYLLLRVFFWRDQYVKFERHLVCATSNEGELIHKLIQITKLI